MNLQNPSGFAGRCLGKKTFSHRGRSPPRGRMTPAPCLWGREALSAGCWQREERQGGRAPTPHLTARAYLCQHPHTAPALKPRGEAPPGGLCSCRRCEEGGRGVSSRSDPVSSVTQLCRAHKDDTGCALLAVRLMFGNKKTDGFICLMIWCCQEQP